MLGFSPADVARISETVNYVERMPRNRPANRRRHVTGGGFAVYLGKTNVAINKGSSGAVSRYEGSTGTETDTGIDDTCKNRFANVSSGKWVAYVLIDSAYYLIAAEC
jgi:hypothetical protein